MNQAFVDATELKSVNLRARKIKALLHDIIDPDDIDAVASAIGYMLEHPDQRQTWAANTQRVFETFNGSRASDRLVRAYAGLANTRGT